MIRQLTIKPPALVNPFQSSQSQASTPKQETPPPMDPPPLHPAIPAAVAGNVHLNYSDSIESSPRSYNDNNAYDDHLPPVPGARLRLMCSFGGHIMPRPHDKSLCYIGGETRIVAVDRNCSLSALCTRLSRALLGGRSFTMKYQLPTEDLDSLVSVSTDEDLENMIEEYDRLSASSNSSTSSRIRLFLFFNKIDTAASMGPLLNDAKSETWFVDALNGSGLVPRGNSDSATIQTLLNLDGAFDQGDDGVEEQNIKQVKNNNLVHEVQCSLPDSPLVEKTSSFGSSSSSPSMSILPPIRVRVDQDGGPKGQDQRVGIEEQFAQISFATNNIHKQDECYGSVATGATLPPHPVSSVANTMAPRPGGSSDNLNRILSDDERSDQGVPVAFRKPPLPLQPVQHKAGGNYNLPSPDSVASDSSFASANSHSKAMYYQDQTHSRTGSGPNSNADTSIQSSQIQIQQSQDSSYSLSSQMDQQQQQQQQQFVQDGIHYIPHPTPAAAPMPMTSYYPVYAAPLQQQLHHPTDQQYPTMYVMQPQPYMSMQSNTGVMTMKSNAPDASSIMAPSHPLAPPTPYTETVPPIYPTTAATLAKPEMGATVYRTVVPSTHQVVQVQQPFVGYSQMQHPQQPTPPITNATNYRYEYPTPAQDQVYYAQHQAPQLPPQYQSLTPAAAAAALADASKQLPPNDGSNQQMRISQP